VYKMMKASFVPVIIPISKVGTTLPVFFAMFRAQFIPDSSVAEHYSTVWFTKHDVFVL
jgi:hypothetical protein